MDYITDRRKLLTRQFPCGEDLDTSPGLRLLGYFRTRYLRL